MRSYVHQHYLDSLSEGWCRVSPCITCCRPRYIRICPLSTAMHAYRIHHIEANGSPRVPPVPAACVPGTAPRASCPTLARARKCLVDIGRLLLLFLLLLTKVTTGRSLCRGSHLQTVAVCLRICLFCFCAFLFHDDDLHRRHGFNFSLRQPNWLSPLFSEVQSHSCEWLCTQAKIEIVALVWAVGAVFGSAWRDGCCVCVRGIAWGMHDVILVREGQFGWRL